MPARANAAPKKAPTTSGTNRRRKASIVVLVLLVLLAAGLGRFVGGIGKSEQPVDRPVATGPLTIEAHSFDPFGSNKTEHESEAALAIDNNASTAWSTETYVDRKMGKQGVGLTLRMPSSNTLSRLEVQSRSTGWSAAVYVANGTPNDLPGWGEPVDTQSGLGNSAAFDLHQKAGDSVLLWITDLGNGRQFAAAEVRVIPQAAG